MMPCLFHRKVWGGGTAADRSGLVSGLEARHATVWSGWYKYIMVTGILAYLQAELHTLRPSTLFFTILYFESMPANNAGPRASAALPKTVTEGEGQRQRGQDFHICNKVD